MLEAFLISIAANLATAAGAKALSLVIDKTVYRKIDIAFDNAVKKWTKNNQIADKESIWTRKRLEELTLLMSTPSKENEVDKATLLLLQLFKLELQQDSVTWHYLEGEFYRNLMSNLLDVKNTIDLLKAEIDANKINPIDLKNKLISQTYYQVDKNITSGKYIPDTFLEVNEHKDHLRYFVDPFVFYTRIFNKTDRFNFDYLNRKLQNKGRELFEFDVSSYKIENFYGFELSYENSKVFSEYLNQKHDELYNGGNDSWKFSSKVRRRKEDVNYINGRICILTANAGQGKTNFICDFANNVLVKRGIPSLYLNGYEIDAFEIENSLSRAIYPMHNYAFNDILKAIEEYCTYTNKPFVIIIEGLNENSNSQLLCTNLNRLIKELLNHRFVKIILTCRTEYYQDQFSDLGRIHEQDTIIINHIHAHLNEIQKERLVSKYLNFFKINVSLSEDIQNELTENLLLLRIFSEAYQNQTLPYIYNLHKDELFKKYYQTMCDNISKKISANNGYISLNAHLIQSLIEKIISYMIGQECFTNIPICDILNTNEQDQIALYNRFLDENVILRRDLITSSGVFGTTEVINFTYDEFRDYLISSYLIDVIHLKSEEQFNQFVVNHTDNKERLAEGIRSFLFLIAKKHKNSNIHLWLKSLDWYERVFVKHIWEIDDHFIDDNDIELIKKLLPKYNKRIIPNLIFRGRWDTTVHTKININILLGFLIAQEDSEIREKLYEIWAPNTDYDRYDKGFDQLLDIHEELLLDEKFFSNPEAHNVFEFFLYLTPFSYRAKDIYVGYLRNLNNIDRMENVQEHCHSEKLKSTINFLKREYETRI